MIWSVIIDHSVRHVDFNLSFINNHIYEERKYKKDLLIMNYMNASVITIDKFIG